MHLSRRHLQRYGLATIAEAQMTTLVTRLDTLKRVRTAIHKHQHHQQQQHHNKTTNSISKDSSLMSTPMRTAFMAHALSAPQKLDRRRKSLLAGLMNQLESIERDLQINKQQIRAVDLEIDALKDKQRRWKRPKSIPLSKRGKPIISKKRMNAEAPSQEEQKKLRANVEELLAKKNLLSQHRLKNLGRRFGDLLVNGALNRDVEIQQAEFIFGRYCLHFHPKAFHYNALLCMASKRGNMISAITTFTKMEDGGVQPDLKTFVHLVKGFVKQKDLPEVMKWFAKMKKYHIKPDAELMDEVIKGISYRLDKQEDKSEEQLNFLLSDLMEIMVSNRWQLQSRTLKLIAKLSIVRDRNSWEKLEKDLMDADCINAGGYNALLDFYSKRGNVKAGLRVIRKMEVKDIASDQKLINGLLHVCSVRGDQNAVNLLRRNLPEVELPKRKHKLRKEEVPQVARKFLVQIRRSRKSSSESKNGKQRYKR